MEHPPEDDEQKLIHAMDTKSRDEMKLKMNRKGRSDNEPEGLRTQPKGCFVELPTLCTERRGTV